MKKSALLLITMLCCLNIIVAQVPSVDVDGAVKVGFVSGTSFELTPGTIRWTGLDFEGWTGSRWKSLTSDLNEYVEDIDGNVYPTFKIGSKIWMAEDLKVTKYNEGSSINIKAAGAFIADGNNSIASARFEIIGTFPEIRGAYFYNWFAVNTGILCPSGWHVATSADWVDLTNSLNIVNPGTQGGKMKVTDQASLIYWFQPNVGATNSSGFNGLGNGIINEFGILASAKEFGHWWQAEQSSAPNGRVYFTSNFNDDLSFADKFKIQGAAVRCVKN